MMICDMVGGMNFWDERFSGDAFKYGTRPNAFLAEQAHRLPPGARVLVPGDGEGRNSVWLAEQGFDVTAMDSSSVGLEKGARLASGRGVKVDTVLADLAEWTPPAGQFDAVVLVYVHLPSSIRAAAHQRLAKALCPGGWLILEGFHPEQLKHNSGGPKDVDMLMTPTLLDADFGGLLTPVLSWEGETTLDEGPGHQGLARVTRWVGCRSA
ncbi:class I SAM-dependent methyltransferase [Hydrogenophaga sp. 5NK40-0174]|uniref:class I SAM-dependent methyltransferase n=1 Tax=Hydrogenophaga sp. 5NK40-0174 TaxID=3127649 RepID=UPI0031021B12